MRRLPPLRALQAFEASARTGSFSKAASELNVTPAAISLQVKALEGYLGVELFIRRPQSLTLTPAAIPYLAAMTSAFEIMEAATKRVMPPRAKSALSLAAPPAFALNWLVPRIEDFRRTEPDIDLQITSTARTVDPVEGEFDAVIRFGRGGWLGFEADLLLVEQLVPVCSPGYAATMRRDDFPRRLDQEILLVALSRPDDWSNWLDAFAPESEARDRLQFGDCALVIQAALSGNGIALCDWPLVAADIATGKLIIPAPNLTLSRGTGYFLVYRTNASPQVHTLRDWLLDETSAHK